MMRKTIAAALAAAALLAAQAGTASAASCIRAKGWGTGVTEGVASFMAQAAMKSQAKGWGGEKVKIGPAVTRCKFELGFQCNASAKACK